MPCIYTIIKSIICFNIHIEYIQYIEYIEYIQYSIFIFDYITFKDGGDCVRSW